MKVTKEQVAAILNGEDSHGLIILNLMPMGGIEIAIAQTGRMAPESIRAMAQAAATWVADAAMRMDGCQCPKCQAAKALSRNAPTAQA